MTFLDRDPEHISKTVRFLRKMYRLTQENLADAANVATRTVEKIESGRHKPDEQTLRSIARVFGLDVSIFRKPTPEEDARLRRELEHAARHTVLVPTRRIRTAGDFLNAFDQRHGWRFDVTAVESDAALQVAAALTDWIRDLSDIWDEVSMSHRVEYAQSCAGLVGQLEEIGYMLHIGDHKQRLRQSGKSDLVFDVGLAVVLKADQASARYAVVHVEKPWEIMEDDAVSLPPE